MADTTGTDAGRDAGAHKAGLTGMLRVDAIWQHPVYRTACTWLERLERDRAFCRHGLRHLMDTARIMWILNLEEGLGLDREVVYGTALLHDIGKPVQYTRGVPHEEAGARLAAGILADLSGDVAFMADERRQMVAAIRGHRRLRPDAEPLERLLFRADKASRPCFACSELVRRACSWPDAKKNLSVRV